MGGFREFWRLFSRNTAGVIGLCILGVIIFVAVFAGLLFPTDPLEMVTRPLLSPGQNPEFLLGSDMLGRDVAAGIAHGARVSLLIGLVAMLVSVVLGITIGAISGFYGGWVDDILMRTTEIFMTIPHFMFLLALVALLQPSVGTITFAIGFVSWPTVARLVRAECISLREREFVQAGIGIGMGDMRLILTQIMPNAMAPVIVTSSILVATAILNESALAFLGLGDPNVMSWGAIIGSGRMVVRSAWHLTVFPGLAILVTVLALNFVGDALNDALNPRLRHK